MSRIPREFINELLNRCDIVELIHTRVPLQKKGQNYLACCPFHKEKTPSFTVSATKQFYYCFGCQAGGNAIGFLMQYEHLTFVEAVEKIAQQLRMPIPKTAGIATVTKPAESLYPLMQEIAHYYQQQLFKTPTVIDYIKQRGLNETIVREFNLGYAPVGWDSVVKKWGSNAQILTQLQSLGMIIKKDNGGFYDRFRDRLMFPIRDRQGRVIAFGGRILQQGEPKYLNSPETPIFHKGSELYGLFEASLAEQRPVNLLVVEGYMDAIALAQHGIRNVVATLGTATTPEHIARLFRLTQEVIFCFDGDRAGQTAAWRALETVLPLYQEGWQVRFLFLPEGEDPDSLVRKEGATALLNRLNSATPLADFLINKLTQQTELSSSEGKIRLIKLAAPLLKKLNSDLLRHLLIDRLAHLTRMEITTLRDYIQKADAGNLQVESQGGSRSLKRTPMRLVLALLLQNPHLLPNAGNRNFVEELETPGSELLRELIQFLEQEPACNTAMLVEHWRDRPEAKLMLQLAAWDLGLPAHGLLNELQDGLKHLQKIEKEKYIEALLHQAQAGSLNSEDKLKLQQLIAETKIS